MYVHILCWWFIKFSSTQKQATFEFFPFYIKYLLFYIGKTLALIA